MAEALSRRTGHELVTAGEQSRPRRLGLRPEHAVADGVTCGRCGVISGSRAIAAARVGRAAAGIRASIAEPQNRKP
jgi:hypothetical protein